jgi:signal transduction histidine kinase/CheY-like chemotaxis protein
MAVVDKAFAQVLTWRPQRARLRIGHILAAAALSVAIVGPWPVAVWMTGALALSFLERVLCGQALARPGSLPALIMAEASLSATSLAVLALSLAARGAVAQGALMLCAINLNNAVVTRASRLGAVLILGPSSAALLGMLIATGLFGHGQGVLGLGMLERWALGFLVFTGLLVGTLHREARVLRQALADQDRQRRRAESAMDEAVQSRRRWRGLFEQSPLPQSYFSARRLFALLQPHIEAGETRLGARLRNSLSTMAEGLAYIDRIEGNEAVESLFGGLDGRSEDPARFQDGYFAGFCEGLDGMDEDGVLASFDAQLVRPGGELVDVRVHIRMPPGQTPPWNVCMASYVDITAEMRAARAQKAAVEAAEAANRAKSEFLAVMSHEIRTPLNGVLGIAQAMELDPLEPAQKDRLAVIRQSGSALLEVLNDVLDLSKIEAGRLGLECAGFDLEALARSAEAGFGALAARKGLFLEVEVAEAARGTWRGDAARVRQVIYNLVANAVEFTEGGGVVLDVNVEEPGVRITVSDTGIGIEASRIPDLFEKFVQADSTTTRRFGGSGLGLAICRELCGAMGGSITVRSAPAVGSDFEVRLPLERGQLAAPAEAPTFNRDEAPAIRPLRVLAAEDNAVNQLVLKTLLNQVGIEPVMASDGAQAVAAFDDGPWDLILMDVQMPKMDGLAATRAIRTREAQAGAAPTPIIALTANAMSHQLEGYRAAGMTGVLAKPIEVARLYAALAEVCAEGSDSRTLGAA